MANTKYTLLTDKAICVPRSDQMLYRIKALRDIPWAGVSAGDIGGHIASEYNLGTDDDSWVGYGAMVFDAGRAQDKALVLGSATVFYSGLICDEAQISGHVWIMNNAVVAGKARFAGELKITEGYHTVGQPNVERLDARCRDGGLTLHEAAIRARMAIQALADTQ